jgi:hypothetical protein
VEKKTEEAAWWASAAAFIGGAWCGYAWFGWPFVDSTSRVQISPGGWFSEAVYETITNQSFSIFAVLGNGVLGVFGFIAMLIMVAAISPDAPTPPKK